jgi:hypothetical protein
MRGIIALLLALAAAGCTTEAAATADAAAVSLPRAQLRVRWNYAAPFNLATTIDCTIAAPVVKILDEPIVIATSACTDREVTMDVPIGKDMFLWLRALDADGHLVVSGDGGRWITPCPA